MSITNPRLPANVQNRYGMSVRQRSNNVNSRLQSTLKVESLTPYTKIATFAYVLTTSIVFMYIFILLFLLFTVWLIGLK